MNEYITGGRDGRTIKIDGNYNISLVEIAAASHRLLDVFREGPINKPKLVLFEGADKVGKSTQFKQFRESTQYVPLCIDRFTGSNYVYDQFYGRTTDLTNYLVLEDILNQVFDCYLILLVAGDEHTHIHRIYEEEPTNELQRTLQNFSRVQDLFLDYYNKTRYDHKFILDTTSASIKSNGKIIYDFVMGGNNE
jgi:thymidylate kinase